MALLPLVAQVRGENVSCPIVKIEAERLADLNVPRESTLLLCLNGEPTVIGGHTTNFVPTPRTAAHSARHQDCRSVYEIGILPRRLILSYLQGMMPTWTVMEGSISTT